MTRLTPWTFPLLLVAFALAGCSPSDSTTNAPVPPEEVADATPPDTSGREPKAPDAYKVKLDTTEGEVVIAVTRSLAPRGADRFYRLVKEGFYDGAKFFRVLPGFMAQVGIAADPKVHAKWGDANFPDDPVKASNTRGMVTFAKMGVPNSRSTQFFINYGDNSYLDPDGFAPFGEVKSGMEAVEKFYSGYGETPNQGSISSQGNEYLDAEFPELDAIKTARVISENGKPVADAAEAAAETPEAADTPETPSAESGTE
jgi:cyclophilin family peptidyl-prolyl cis-trans isomerase